MARLRKVPQFLHLFLYFSVILCTLRSFSCSASANRELNEDDWKDILEGEWMVEFYAPWCPACNALQPTWKELSSRAARKNLAMKTAGVDVTQSPGLSGRFVVTALPTIFHVKAGEFRQYKGPRDVDSMLSYVEQERWRQTDPIPSWKAPHSLQMSLVAEFFKLSQALRSVHNMLMEQYGLPTWGSYLIFAIATIFIGAVLGLVLVCIIDLLYPPKRHDRVFISKEDVDKMATGDQDGKERSDDDNELVNEDIEDDAENNSDAERNSPSDSSSDEKPAAGDSAHKDSASKEVDSEGSKPSAEVRKRRPRKAD